MAQPPGGPVGGSRVTKYFMPGEVVFLAEHENRSPRQVVNLLSDATNKLRQAAPDEPNGNVQIRAGLNELYAAVQRLSSISVDQGGPILTFPRLNQPRRVFSLVFVKGLTLPDDVLMQLLEYVDSRIRQGLVYTPEFDLKTLTPNWLVGGAPLHGSTGGPGARPRPADPLGKEYHNLCDVSVPNTPFSFTLPALPQVGTQETQVEVAILDTAPPPDSLEQAFVKWSDQHPLICSLLAPGGNLTISYFRDFLPAFDGGRAFQALRADYGIDGHEYPMFDHGLFATGIIHTIAPYARLHLVEVLNHYGVGTLETLSVGLRWALEKRQNSPLIINCSLMLDVPLEGHPAPDFPLKDFRAKFALLSRMAQPLRYIYDELAKRCLEHRVENLRNVLTVAAAGNDGDSSPVRPQARFPAAFDSVTGVAALGANGLPTGYSNLADRAESIGIATFGGDARTIPSRGGASNAGGPLEADPNSGILGVYIGEFPDPNGQVLDAAGNLPNPQPNSSGWARWAGTSFAAPIVSGALARAIQQGTPINGALQALQNVQPQITSASEEIFRVTQP